MASVIANVSLDTSLAHKELAVLEARVKRLKDNWYSIGPVGALFNFFKGRCTFFAILFSGVGIALAFMGKLTAEYVGLVGAIQALLVAHSVKEDMNDLKQGQTVVTTTVS